MDGGFLFLLWARRAAPATEPRLLRADGGGRSAGGALGKH